MSCLPLKTRAAMKIMLIIVIINNLREERLSCSSISSGIELISQSVLVSLLFITHYLLGFSLVLFISRGTSCLYCSNCTNIHVFNVKHFVVLFVPGYFFIIFHISVNGCSLVTSIVFMVHVSQSCRGVDHKYAFPYNCLVLIHNITPK